MTNTTGNLDVNNVLADDDFKLSQKEIVDLNMLLIYNKEWLISKLEQWINIWSSKKFNPKNVIKESLTQTNIDWLSEEEIALVILYIKLKGWDDFKICKISGNNGDLKQVLNQYFNLKDKSLTDKKQSDNPPARVIQPEVVKSETSKQKTKKPDTVKPEAPKQEIPKSRAPKPKTESQPKKPKESSEWSDNMIKLKQSRNFVDRNGDAIRQALDSIDKNDHNSWGIFAEIIFTRIFEKPLSKANAVDDILNLQLMINDWLPDWQKIPHNWLIDQQTLQWLQNYKKDIWKIDTNKLQKPSSKDLDYNFGSPIDSSKHTWESRTKLQTPITQKEDFSIWDQLDFVSWQKKRPVGKSTPIFTFWAPESKESAPRESSTTQTNRNDVPAYAPPWYISQPEYRTWDAKFWPIESNNLDSVAKQIRLGSNFGDKYSDWEYRRHKGRYYQHRDILSELDHDATYSRLIRWEKINKRELYVLKNNMFWIDRFKNSAEQMFFDRYEEWYISRIKWRGRWAQDTFVFVWKEKGTLNWVKFHANYIDDLYKMIINKSQY